MEDDLDLGETLLEVLQDNGYDVSLVTDGIEASDATYDTHFDLYVFDINVPEFNGIELLHALRDADDKTPTIFISAMLDLETISEAFSVGAEDYIKKPFYPEELIIRIKAKLQEKRKKIHYCDLTYDPENELVTKENEELRLSRMQMLLFQIFIQKIGEKISKEEILHLTEISSESALRVAINKLKHSTNLNIQNIHGVGYILETC